MSDSRDNIAIFNCLLLGRSETFVRAQAQALQSFSPVFVGSRCVRDGLTLPLERTFAVNSGGMLGHAREALFKYTGRAPRVERRLAQLQPALMHAHFGLGGALALPLARRLHVPLLVTFHGADATICDDSARKLSHTHRIYVGRRKALFRGAARIIAVSDFIRRKVIEQGAPREKVVVHYIGIDTGFFTHDASTPREPVILFVGRLVEKKGCDDLIRAMREVHAKLPHAKLRIIGGGPDRAKLEQLAMASLPLNSYQFLGMQPPEVVRDHIRRAQVFSVPSVTARSGDAEGFGLVFAEAQAMGTPVVSTRSGGIPEAVSHDRTGVLVDERDPHALAGAITMLLQNPDRWHEFSQNGIRFVRENFDLAAQTAKLEDLYRAIAAQRTATDPAALPDDAPALA